MVHISFDRELMITYEEKAFSGVNKVAELVREDIFRVTGFKADRFVKGTECKILIIFGTVDRSEYLEKLDRNGNIRLSDIRGKWESYIFKVVDNPFEGVEHALVIAGSDKR